MGGNVPEAAAGLAPGGRRVAVARLGYAQLWRRKLRRRRKFSDALAER